jgi:hypothetical protein
MLMKRIGVAVVAGLVMVSVHAAFSQDKNDNDKKKDEKVVVAGTPATPPPQLPQIRRPTAP